jgi:D-alanyl-D-alanine carboxypeptidase/D-alanyl-D-alanine-endopeptidase (penicillin-binding protein 4)
VILVNARPRMVAFVAGLTILATFSSEMVQAAGPQSIPPAPAAGPVFQPLESAQLLSANSLKLRTNKFWAKPTLGRNVTALVIDSTSGAVLLDRNSEKDMTPASTIKLVTAAAAIERLGATRRFATRVTQQGNVLTLVGGGDPTLTSLTAQRWRGKPAGVQRPASLEELAAVTAKKLAGTAGPFILNIDKTFFEGSPRAKSWPASYIAGGYVAPVTGLTVDFGVTKNDEPLGDPAKYAGQFLVSKLRKLGVKVSYGKASASPASATDIAQVESATVTDIVERMLTTSNNTMAEYLAHHVGRVAGDSTFEGSAKAVTETIRDLGINSRGMTLSDGSGLSHDDKVSARTLVDVFNVAQHSKQQLWPILSGLPIAGVSGTLAKRYGRNDMGRGYVLAKTGTLSGVVSLAGSAVDKNGDFVFFAVIANDVNSGYDAELSVDSMLQSLAGCGCK